MVIILLLIFPQFSSAEISIAKFKQIADTIESIKWGANPERTQKLTKVYDSKKKRVSVYQNSEGEDWHYFNNRLYQYTVYPKNFDEAEKMYGYLDKKFGEGMKLRNNRAQWDANSSVFIYYVKYPRWSAFKFILHSINKENIAYSDKVNLHQKKVASKALNVKGLYLGMYLEDAKEICDKDFKKFIPSIYSDMKNDIYSEGCDGSYCFGDLDWTPYEISADNNQIVDKIVLTYIIFNAQDSGTESFARAFSKRYDIPMKLRIIEKGAKREKIYSYKNDSYFTNIGHRYVVMGKFDRSHFNFN